MCVACCALVVVVVDVWLWWCDAVCCMCCASCACLTAPVQGSNEGPRVGRMGSPSVDRCHKDCKHYQRRRQRFHRAHNEGGPAAHAPQSQLHWYESLLCLQALCHRLYNWEQTRWVENPADDAEKLLANNLLKAPQEELGPLYAHYKKLGFASPSESTPANAVGQQVLYIQLDTDGVNISEYLMDGGMMM